MFMWILIGMFLLLAAVLWWPNRSGRWQPDSLPHLRRYDALDPLKMRILRIVAAPLMFSAWLENDAGQWIAAQAIPATYDQSSNAFYAAVLTLTFFIACLYVAVGPQRPAKD